MSWPDISISPVAAVTITQLNRTTSWWPVALCEDRNSYPIGPYTSCV